MKRNPSEVQEQLERTKKMVEARELRETVAEKNRIGSIMIFAAILGVAIGIEFSTALGFAAFSGAVLWKIK